MNRILAMSALAAALTAAQPSTAAHSTAAAPESCAAGAFCDPSSCDLCPGSCPLPCAEGGTGQAGN